MTLINAISFKGVAFFIAEAAMCGYRMFARRNRLEDSGRMIGARGYLVCHKIRSIRPLTGPNPSVEQPEVWNWTKCSRDT